MKLLIDTHAFIWFCEDDKNLSTTAKAEIEKIDNEVSISAASLWEITIKLQLRKLALNKTLGEILKFSPLNGFQYLDIKPTHLLQLYPWDFIHKDSFGRILVAHALADDMVLVTKDENIWQYPAVKLLW